jgi:alcohol dehydrogenase class IV
VRFEFATAGRILFGPGTLTQLPSAMSGFGKRVLVVTGSRPERADRLCALLTASAHQVVRFSAPREPDLALVEAGIACARAEGCEAVVAFGGGSVIDTGKAVAGLVPNEGAVLDYLEVVGLGHPLGRPGLPFVAIPTTAGTGAEVTRNAVIGVPAQCVKVSLRSPYLLPRLAVVDPELALDLPPEVTAASGLDALTQLIEPFVSARANPLTDALCREAIPRAARALPRAFENGNDRAAREEMAWASLAGGLALANAGLGVVHGFAGPLGGLLNAPHGALCAALLPHGVRANLAALRSRAPGHPALARYEEVARLLTGRPQALADEGASWLEALVHSLGVPRLKALGLTEGAMAGVVERARQASSMKANPIELSADELANVLSAAL